MVQSFCPTVYINIATILLCAVLTRDNARQKLCGASVAQNHGQFFSRYFWQAASQRSKIQSLGHGVTPATVQLQGHVVESTDRFTYLGSDIHSSERSTPEILRSSFKYFQQTGQRLKADRIEFTDEDIRLYNALVISVLLYGSETWTLLKADERRLEAFHVSV